MIEHRQERNGMKKRKMKQEIAELRKQLKKEGRLYSFYYFAYQAAMKCVKEQRKVIEMENHRKPMPTMTDFYAKEEMERSARAILSQDAVYPDSSLRSVDSEDDLPEM